uniref:Uncharacterized protein n=1 Tax=viral metagenome TaxID=1070528 RepID=A0A6C0CRX6_9ZZZZ
MSRTYLLSVIFGFLLFLVIYWYVRRTKIEMFETATTSTTTTVASTSGDANTIDTKKATELVSSLQSLLSGLASYDESKKSFTYIEDPSQIPNVKNLDIYLSTFSDFTAYNTKLKGYEVDRQKWNNHVRESEPFMLLTSESLPASIRNPPGMPLNNLVITGPRSDELSGSDYMIKEFSMCFFVKNNTFIFDENRAPIEIFRVFVETPYYLLSRIEPDETDSTKVKLITIVGLDVDDVTKTHRYSITIPISTLKSSGNNILISIVYNTDNDRKKGILNVHIGTTSFTAETDTPPAIIVGNSRIRINGNGKWDARLFGYMYFKTAITKEQHEALIQYFNKQLSGIAAMLDELKKLTEEQLQDLDNLVKQQSLSIEDIRKELEQCKILQGDKDKAKEKAEEDKWTIKMDGYKPVSDAELEKCTLLKVDNLYKNLSDAASGTATSATTTTSKVTPTTIPKNLDQGSFQLKLPFNNINMLSKDPKISKIVQNYFNDN